MAGQQGLMLGGGLGTSAAGGLTLGGTSMAGAAGGLQLGQFKLGQTPASSAAGLQLGQSSGMTGGLQLGQTVRPQVSTSVGGLQLGQGLSLGQPQTSLAAGLQPQTSGLQLGQALKLGQPQSTATSGGLQLGQGLRPGQPQTSLSAGGLQLGQAGQLQTGITSMTRPALPGGLTTTAGGGGLTLQAKSQAQQGTGTAVPAAPQRASRKYTFKELEDLINKWSVELEDQEKVFLQQAQLVNAWDRLLAENGDKITDLNEKVQRVKADQERLDSELELIHTQQSELEDILLALEGELQNQPAISAGHHADLERTRTYQMAESVDSQLKRMAKDLKDIIEQMNAANTAQEEESTVASIVKILSAHADSLNWVDRNGALLQQKVEEVSKLTEARRREQERQFRLAFDGRT